MKVCGVCGLRKELSEFNKKSATRLQAHCRDCSKAIFKQYYLKNRKHVYNKNRIYTAHLRKIVLDAKDKPCADCGIQYPFYVMEFDHRDRAAKVIELARAHLRGSRKLILDEIAKCDVVCSNCHRQRTHEHIADVV